MDIPPGCGPIRSLDNVDITFYLDKPYNDKPATLQIALDNGFQRITAEIDGVTLDQIVNAAERLQRVAYGQ